MNGFNFALVGDASVDPPSREEERKFFEAYQCGACQKRRQQLINYYGRLAVSIARRKLPGARSLSLEDLVQEGMIGLMHSASLFDAKKGFRFSTYAAWAIERQIQRAIDNDSRMIRIPVGEEILRRACAHLKETLTKQGIAVTDDMLAEAMELTLDRVAELQAEVDPLSLDACAKGMDAPLGDLMLDTDCPDPSDLAISLVASNVLTTAMRRHLTLKEFDVLAYRFGLHNGVPETLEEVGLRYGLTRERIRQIEGKALRKLRAKASHLASLVA